MSSEHIPPTITIEPAQEPDFDWCAQLMAGSEPWITLRLDLEQSRMSLRRPGGELFVAREGGQPVSEIHGQVDHVTVSGTGFQPVGFIQIHPYGFAGSPYITSIGVAADARGKGIGAQLLAFTEQHVVDRRFIFLCVSSFNHRAQEFYRRHGYARVGEIPNYVVEGHSELVLCKKLS
jgi:ribosomal protein S18 acetylase RimI-like enzyme